jgi:hypothetical protein
MAFALVANTSRATSGTSAGITTTGANLLVAALAWTTATIGEPAVSDSNSNVWFPIAFTTAQQTSSIGLYAAFNPTVGASHTFTITGSTTSGCFAAFSGCATRFATNINTRATTGGATSLAPGSLTPPVDNCLIVSALSNRVNTTYSVSGSLSITDQINFTSGVQVGVALAYLIQTSAAASNPSWSWSGSGVAGAIQCYFQTPPASGGGAFASAG